MTKDREDMRMRSRAASYAKTFLVRKYYTEYRELYTAYLNNRGHKTYATKELVDERIVNA